jgi:hypothetical protein
MQKAISLKVFIRVGILYALLTTIVLVYLVIQSVQDDKVTNVGLLRAEGIVIIDSAGRERILIGAPIPFAKNRVRTDTSRVRQKWAEQLGGESYMEWYTHYQHSCNGIVLLNDKGYDVLALGDKLPDPNTGQRITEPTGMVWNDSLGFERGGIGLGKLHGSGKYRNVFGLDDENGEGFHLSILEDGTKSMRIVSDDQMLYLGYFPQKGILGDSLSFFGARRVRFNGEEASKISF